MIVVLIQKNDDSHVVGLDFIGVLLSRLICTAINKENVSLLGSNENLFLILMS